MLAVSFIAEWVRSGTVDLELFVGPIKGDSQPARDAVRDDTIWTRPVAAWPGRFITSPRSKANTSTMLASKGKMKGGHDINDEAGLPTEATASGRPRLQYRHWSGRS